MGTKGCKISFSKVRFAVINHCSPQHNRLSYLWVSLRGQTGQIQSSQVALLWIYSCCLKHMWFCLEAGCAPCPFSPLILRQSLDTHLFLCISDFCFLSFTFFLFVISCCASIWWEYNKLPLPTFHVYMFVFGLCVCRSPRSLGRGGLLPPLSLRTLSGRPGVCLPKRYGILAVYGLVPTLNHMACLWQYCPVLSKKQKKGFCSKRNVKLVFKVDIKSSQ